MAEVVRIRENSHTLGISAMRHAAAVLMISLSLGTADAALIYDASTPTISSFQEVGQSLTVGLAGILTRVDVLLTPLSPTGSLTLEVLGVSSGVPSGAVLASATVAAASVVDGFNAFDLSAANLGVGLGDLLSFILKGEGD